MDIAIERTGAERGALVLISDEGEAEVRVARNMKKEDLENPEEISFTIIRNCFKTGKPVLTTNAKTDPRFLNSSSIMLYNILSIVAVPIPGRKRVQGVVYLDSRTARKIFSQEDLNFLLAFHQIAGIALEKVKKEKNLIYENFRLKSQLKEDYSFEGIVGKSRAIKSVINILPRVIASDVPVLIEGESGTGKELIARVIHNSGQRSKRPFVPVYCGAFPANLLESELFGYKKGAFTGAVSDKMGLFEEADGGTFFLDEIAEVPLPIQTKLLRVLEHGVFRRLGDTKERKANVRLISATNRNLEELVKKGEFREDLYYRIKVIKIVLPPLRERKEDIPLLIEHFLKKYRKSELKVSKEAMDLFVSYNWPGNVRELENAVAHAIVMCTGKVIKPEHLPPEIVSGVDMFSEPTSLKDMEKKLIIQTLQKTGWNKKKSAEILGISTRTLHNKIKEYGLSEKNSH